MQRSCLSRTFSEVPGRRELSQSMQHVPVAGRACQFSRKRYTKREACRDADRRLSGVGRSLLRRFTFSLHRQLFDTSGSSTYSAPLSHARSPSGATSSCPPRRSACLRVLSLLSPRRDVPLPLGSSAYLLADSVTKEAVLIDPVLEMVRRAQPRARALRRRRRELSRSPPCCRSPSCLPSAGGP